MLSPGGLSQVCVLPIVFLMKSILGVLFLWQSYLFAAVESLPRGGTLRIDSKLWDARVLDHNFNQMMIFVHKEHQDLQGYVLGGLPQTEQSCKAKKKSYWALCHQTLEIKELISVQYLIERKVGKGYQPYVISFNVSKEKFNIYKKELEAFKKMLEQSR
jgi:hypothetical protein